MMPVTARLGCMIGSLLPLALLTSCTSLEARRAFEAGDYAEAAELYDEVHERHGFDRALERRDLARARAVEISLAQLERRRHYRDGRLARNQLERVLAQAKRWHRPFTSAEQAQIDDLVSWSVSGDHEASLTLLEQGHPLDARRALPHRPALLEHPAYARERAEVMASIHDAGVLRCHELLRTTSSWTRLPDLVARYCREFDTAPGPTDQRVAACDQVQVTTTTELPDDERTQLEHEVRRLMKKTPYVHPRGDCTLDVQVTASRRLDTTREMTQQVARWSVSVPYTDRVLRTQLNTKYETKTETHMVKEPYTATVLESQTCGYEDEDEDDRCTRLRTETKYRLVPKTETRRVPVTKSRQVWVNQTRYRTEPREHTYEAVEVVHSFVSAGKLAVVLPTTEARLELPWSSQSTTRGLEHDEDLPAADLHPSRVPAPEPSRLAEHDLRSLRQAWAEMLPSRIEAESCHSGPDIDRAVACLLYVGKDAVPQQGREALSLALGESFENLARLVHRARE